MLVACVRTGGRYPPHYVFRLRDMVAKHLKRSHRFVCFTDRMGDLEGTGVAAVDIETLRLKSWWGKMALFARDWREDQRVLYFDLDTVIIGDLAPLADLSLDFGICENFTRLSGNVEWPCSYGSCVMTFGPSFDGELFARFWKDRFALMDRAGKFGDQKTIEELMPDASLLQRHLPAGFFLGYRNLPKHRARPPKNCSVVIFAGGSKPHNCGVNWVKEAWAP